MRVALPTKPRRREDSLAADVAQRPHQLGRRRPAVRPESSDSFNVVNEVRDWHPHIENAIDSSTTMIEFRKFRARHRDEIERRAEERSRLQTTITAPCPKLPLVLPSRPSVY